ncbi:MAG: hypothetical protein LBT05_15105 [Planctomycetaceae bacterium]|jgi:hypothetical protein|nr:hypothetical protein [Planctomycetaceae bacterium]
MTTTHKIQIQTITQTIIKNAARRDGVILLLVLAMMTMFAMLIATFLIVTSQQYREAESASKIGRYADSSPSDDLQQALDAILVGSNSKSSVIRAFSIAENMYGEPHGIHGLTGYAQYAGNNVIGKTGVLNSDGELQRYLLNYAPGDEPASYVNWLSTIGNVFTVRDPSDPQKWLSTRIVYADYDSNLEKYYVDVWPIANLQDPTTILGSVTDYNFYINPPAYSGTGAGYVRPQLPLDVSSNPIVDFCVNYIRPRLTAEDGDNYVTNNGVQNVSIPYALQLNPNAPTTSSGLPEFGNRLDAFAWSLNPDYTAPDMRNPFLAWIDPKFTADGNDLAIDPVNSIVIPSYHRPSLIEGYRAKIGSLYNPNARPADPHPAHDLLRKFVMRPLPFDHQNFDGSNPTLANDTPIILAERLADTTGKHLDLDNDSDGVLDSVWIDVGLPVRFNAQGQPYKPLVGILIEDLDSKLNVNAHGNLAEQLTTTPYGVGHGPAGVNLTMGVNSLFQSNPSAAGSIIPEDIVEQLLNGRYADSQKTEFIPRDSSALTQTLLTQFGGLPLANPLINTYGKLPDFWDQGNLAFDPLGNLYNTYTTNPYAVEFPATNIVWNFPVSYETFPYLFDPNRKTPYDQPFTLAELEAVLRNKDGDKDSLPDRLRSIFRDEKDSAENVIAQLPGVLKLARYNTTAISNDVPVPGPALADQEFSSIFALIRECVRKEEKRARTTLNVDGITNQLILMLPEEIRQGGKINLNKLVEDPMMNLIALSGEDYEKALYERMKFARGIYIILMALSYDKLYGVKESGMAVEQYVVYPYVEPSFLEAEAINDLYQKFHTAEVNGTTLTDDQIQAKIDFYQVCRELAVTRLAQWSINLVEFTDIDAIMTPFIFDVNPFDGDGWGTDAIGASLFTDEFSRISAAHNDYRLIWGMERPDLLLTETLAFHKRNVADTECGGKVLTKDYYEINSTNLKYFQVNIDSDGTWSYSFNTSDPTILADINNNLDSMYDQIRMPEGPAFLELYCAADSNRPNFPQELYINKQLDLGRLVANGYPVWRVVVGNSNYKRTAGNSTGQYVAEAHMDYSILHNLKKFGEIFSFQLSNPSLLKGSWVPAELKPKSIDLDRIVWFTSMKPTGTDAEQTYYNHSQNTTTTPLTLAPNQYLVVGPRVETFLTSQSYTSAGTYGNTLGCPKIDLNALIDTSSSIGTYKAMIAAAEVPDPTLAETIPGWGTTWTDYQQNLTLGTELLNESVGLGFSISEPYRSAYYTKPSNPNHAYFPLGTKDPDTATYEATVANPQEKLTGTMPISEAGLVGNGVAPFYKSAFLQRLADPLREYDSETNPYITVDWNMFDLKVYSGERSNMNDESENYFEPSLKEGTATKYFSSRQWGIENTLTGFSRPLPNLWDRYLDLSDDIFDDPKTMVDSSTGVAEAEKSGVFQAIDFSSIDFSLFADRNIPLPYQPEYSVPVTADALAFPQFPVHSLGRLATTPDFMHPNLPALTGEIIVPMSQTQAQTLSMQYSYVNNIQYYGSPIRVNMQMPPFLPENLPIVLPSVKPLITFQNLAWNNAPFANSYEAMQVPASSPGRFGVEFVDKVKDTKASKTNYLLVDQLWTTLPDLTTGNSGMPLDSDGAKNITKRSGSLGSNVRFGHLLNFQHAHYSLLTDTNKPVIDTTLSVKPTVADNDDINTPLIPRQLQFGYPHLNFNIPTNPNDPYEVTRAEFVSLDLGNALNFLNVPSRFAGTRDWYPDANGNACYYSRFREPGKININTASRASIAAALENRPLNESGIGADWFENFDRHRDEAPYRSSASSWLMTQNGAYASQTDSTLLRSDASVLRDPAASQNPNMPVFAQNISDSTAAPNSYMALEGIQRLSDMTTTRSNVFAVWITLGYFEVEKLPNSGTVTIPGNNGISYNLNDSIDSARFNAIYPDGYMLGKEVGIDTGEVRRHRAFYIIDRTIPFGYRRGKKLNSDNAVLLKRMIE